MSRSRRLAAVAIYSISLLFLAGCDHAAIEWRDVTQLPDSVAQATELDLNTQNQVVGRSSPTIQLPKSEAQCAGSVHAARDGGGDWYATWWSARPDSTAEIVVSRSNDGVAWTLPIRVDTTDVGRVGCQRPAPSIAADAGVVHVVYAMTAREGPGIFASHAMDHGLTFHTPVAVVYGERPGLTDVAARGNHVVVAYEDPNTNPQRVGVAFSRTMGHPFEVRETVSSGVEVARDPRVALRDSTVAVTWARGTSGTSRLLRIGVLR